jgi:formylglycine-generating enzyme required for sulfatase activity
MVVDISEIQFEQKGYATEFAINSRSANTVAGGGGLLDMSGNVWEWTRTNYETGEDDLETADSRVLRGGSFYDESHYARCAYRNRYYPGDGKKQYGFRVVVVSPVLRSRL